MISSVDSLLQISDLQSSLEARSPTLHRLIIDLISQPDHAPETVLPEGAYTFDHFLLELKTDRFKRLTLEEKSQYRQDKIQLLEASDHDPPLPPRLRCHGFIVDLYEDADPYCREIILKLLKEIPFVYGPWKAIKKIFKLAEAQNDTVAFGVLAARIDEQANYNGTLSRKTLEYMQRRAGRYYRRLAEASPATYVDSICEALIHVQSNLGSNSLFQPHLYGGSGQKPKYHELWKRSSRPLFSLLNQATHWSVTRFAVSRLQEDFRTELREIDPQWVRNLLFAGSGDRDAQLTFAIWLLKNVPKFEQSQFRELGFHEHLLALLDSNNREIYDYAIAYARNYARDMPTERLAKLLQSGQRNSREFALDLLKARDPRKEVDLDAWAMILSTDAGFELAKQVLRKHYTSKDLTAEWFEGFLLGRPGDQRGFSGGAIGSVAAIEFATELLVATHKPKTLGQDFFVGLLEEASKLQIDHDRPGLQQVVQFCLDQLEKLGVDKLDPKTLQRMLLLPESEHQVVRWVEKGDVAPKFLTADFLKQIVYKPTFSKNEIVCSLVEEGYQLELSEETTATIFAWLADVRQFLPPDLGFEWLMELVQRGEIEYRTFARDLVTKSFLPADFVNLAETEKPAPKKAKSKKKKAAVDLKEQSFVFTGKLATMTRSEAQAKVSDAKGKNSKTVGKSLDYLVIGDEGSSLYGLGRKGSKQVKAESLNEGGAEIKIVSETAFLQMLAGEQREFSGEAVAQGCQKIWDWMMDSDRSKASLSQFALYYLRMHHPDICLRETDRPVDPGAEIPDSFLTFERAKPLFLERRPELRAYGMELAQLELARWQPSMADLMELCDSPYPEVRELVALAMTCDDSPTHRRYRLDPERLEPEAVYEFCESLSSETRALGMRLLEMHPRLRLPEELFRLAESPDRQVRAFVIRSFWSLYRDRELTTDWKPVRHLPKTNIGRKNKQEPTAEELIEKFGPGLPEKPADKPAQTQDIYWLLRRSLFEISPGPPPRIKSPAEQHKQNVSAKYGAKTVDPDEQTVEKAVRRRHISARQAKLNLIETVRDFALEDAAFAEAVLPLLEEFLESSGQSEQAACLVAVTRIKRRFAEA